MQNLINHSLGSSHVWKGVFPYFLRTRICIGPGLVSKTRRRHPEVRLAGDEVGVASPDGQGHNQNPGKYKNTEVDRGVPRKDSCHLPAPSDQLPWRLRVPTTYLCMCNVSFLESRWPRNETLQGIEVSETNRETFGDPQSQSRPKWSTEKRLNISRGISFGVPDPRTH